MGINPIVGAVAACIAGALCIEAIRKKLPKYAEMSIAIVMSAGVGLAGIFSGFVKNAANFNSFLFGSIVAISDFELILVVSVSLIVIAAFILLYRELFFVAFDEKAARLAGVPVESRQLYLHHSHRSDRFRGGAYGGRAHRILAHGGPRRLRHAVGQKL